MRKLPKVVASTDVGKSVTLKIWRNKKMIDKRLTLGRLESSSEFKEKKAELPKKTKELDVDTLKITVRELNSSDIKKRNLNKSLKGAVIVEISKRSPVVGLLNVNDVIIEIQKKPIQKIDNLDSLIKKVKDKGQPLYLTIINNNNQRRYLGVKLK